VAEKSAEKASDERLLDRYDIIAVAVPGASLLFGLWFLFRFDVSWLKLDQVSLGTLGLFTIGSFCAGHIVQAVANLGVDVAWAISGRPTEKLRKQGGGLVDPQVANIGPQIKSILGYNVAADASEAQWKPITAHVAAALYSRGKSATLEKYNAVYGLSRGLTTTLVALCIVALVQQKWYLAVAAAALGIVTLLRMRRFGWYYARELWLQFLLLQPPDQADA